MLDPTQPQPARDRGPRDRQLIVIASAEALTRGGPTHAPSISRAMDPIATAGLPLVLVSDSPAEEVLHLQRVHGITHPFICEGGAALHIPPAYFDDVSAASAGKLAGTSSWEVIEFADRRVQVGRALEAAARALAVTVIPEGACERQFTQPFVLSGGQRRLGAISAALRRVGLRCTLTPRGPYATAVRDPGHALRLLISLYRTHRPDALLVGIGEGWRDRILLRHVDVPVVIRHDSLNQRRLLRRIPSAFVTQATGPAGWSEAILGQVTA